MFVYSEPAGRWNLLKHLDFTTLAVDDWDGDATKTVNGITVTLRNSGSVGVFGPDGSTGLVLAPDSATLHASNSATAPPSILKTLSLSSSSTRCPIGPTFTPTSR